eukprot:scaffold3899_cov393-Prasinococcus_capsulatus_cf.AAC.6
MPHIYPRAPLRHAAHYPAQVAGRRSHAPGSKGHRHADLAPRYARGGPRPPAAAARGCPPPLRPIDASRGRRLASPSAPTTAADRHKHHHNDDRRAPGWRGWDGMCRRDEC